MKSYSFKPMRVPEYNKRFEHIQLKDIDSVYLACEDILNFAQEVVVVFDLDAKLRVVDRRLVSMGTAAYNIMHPRDVFRGAIMNNASSVIVVHNHPSGDPTPSVDDDGITRRLVHTGGIIGIPVVEHFVVGRNGYYSYCRSGKIDEYRVE